MSKTIHTWKTISLIEDDVVLPTGKKITHTTIVHPGAAVILPVTEDKRVILVNQYRPSLKSWLLELPAGTIENQESPLACAKRELEEETGFSAEIFTELGQMTPMVGFCNEIQYLFIAEQLSNTQRLSCDDDEVINVTTFSLDELETKIMSGEITDAKTIACLSKAKLCGYL
ncbi:ADP-ribose pyrophosphatase [Vibrio albus]|uniref:GDP-mannose pyrophosphatase n=1 Tax=Vibrio albus TaxID=2200953 RepID=A0A2U3BDB3_9VIBR|nr:NUDIX hydrolase [Vibrio albus]PWI34742.1 ADP-ribose pyrophosphatase [Vibrio albus]